MMVIHLSRKIDNHNIRIIIFIRLTNNLIDESAKYK